MKIAYCLCQGCSALLLALCMGCTASPLRPTQDTTHAEVESVPANSVHAPISESRSSPSAFHYSRYTLISPAAPIGLIEQPVDITIALSIHGKPTTVLDALRYVLKRSGYRLCESGEAVDAFRTWLLPFAHAHLGPMSLRETLQTLVGPVWLLRFDERTREVCFDAAISDLNVAKENQND